MKLKFPLCLGETYTEITQTDNRRCPRADWNLPGVPKKTIRLNNWINFSTSTFCGMTINHCD